MDSHQLTTTGCRLSKTSFKAGLFGVRQLSIQSSPTYGPRAGRSLWLQRGLLRG